MNETRLRRLPRIPLPRGPEHEAWVVDLTPNQWRNRDWPAPDNAYPYTTAGTWVRMGMPRSGRIRAERLLTRLADYAERMQGDVHDQFKWPRDAPCADLAQLILAKALVEDGTRYVVVTIEPHGRVWFFHQMRRTASWHPKAPRPRGGV